MIVNVLETISSGVARTWCSTFAVDLDFEVGLLHGVNVVLSIARSVALVNDGCDQATTYCDVILGRLSFSFWILFFRNVFSITMMLLLVRPETISNISWLVPKRLDYFLSKSKKINCLNIFELSHQNSHLTCRFSLDESPRRVDLVGPGEKNASFVLDSNLIWTSGKVEFGKYETTKSFFLQENIIFNA